MPNYEVLFKGVTPLLMNRLTDEQLLALHSKERKKFKAPDIPRATAEEKLYETRDGAPYMPTENLMACLIDAGMHVKLDGKRQMSTRQSTLLPGFLQIDDHYIPLLDSSESASAVWEVDMRQGRNPNGGEAVCIIRPRFDEWSMRVHFAMDTESLPETTYRSLIDIAGSRIGLGDFRPQRRGIFGRFRVDSWKSIS